MWLFSLSAVNSKLTEQIPANLGWKMSFGPDYIRQHARLCFFLHFLLISQAYLGRRYKWVKFDGAILVS